MTDLKNTKYRQTFFSYDGDEFKNIFVMEGLSNLLFQGDIISSFDQESVL